uniref:NADH-ubiquinone oxidoreductase chain 5 n=1 Tax=Metacrangonyx repens TaxID=1199184 RepID=K7ZVR4_9CRUS|nr:NADH dehydrogenase subunit 5 [Metacrangonyx repens]CCI69414.1 NADH dehydrogenase subunit 5 [Metacrangonyx repens]
MNIKKSIYYISMMGMYFMALISFLLFMILMSNNKSIFLEWELFSLNGVSMIFLILLDWMSCMFMFTVSLISAVICGYSKYYMEGDKHYKRFMMVLLLFVGSMILLILSPNMISLLLGWDGLGLTSYILVVYYQNEYACNSGMLTILSNRIGDAMILICICLMSCNSSWNFLLETMSSKLMLILLITSAITKSAQIPFSAWLPAAMAAPTPVSALVHSSTLVTAGVYILIRFYPCFYDPSIYIFLLIISSLTMVMSGLMANFEMDMKKIIALSTLSQLGLMMMIIPLGLSELAFFHLITHAMFKSTIFMCAGIMIHNMMGSQDLRLSGNFFSNSPFLGLFFSVSNLSLCGFPFLAGYFSKDLILENIISCNMNIMFHFMSMLGTGLTISYSLRAMYFMSNTSTSNVTSILSDMSIYLMKTTAVMFFMTMVSGFFISWLTLPNMLLVMNLTYVNKFYIGVIIMMFFYMMIMYLKNNNLIHIYKMNTFKKSFYLMMYLPFITTQFISGNIFKESYKLSKIIDSGWVEYLLGFYMYKYFNLIYYKFIFSQVSSFLKTFLISMFMIIMMMMNFY